MLTLTIVTILCGAVLGLRYKIFILLPAATFMLVFVIGVGVARDVLPQAGEELAPPEADHPAHGGADEAVTGGVIVAQRAPAPVLPAAAPAVSRAPEAATTKAPAAEPPPSSGMGAAAIVVEAAGSAERRCGRTCSRPDAAAGLLF